MSSGRFDEVSRREFLRTTGAAALGLGAMSTAGRAEAGAQSSPADPKVLLPHGRLGRTGHPVTLASFGAILLKGSVGARVLQLAIDRGVNLVHTSASYGNGASVAACGELFKDVPAYREKIYLCLKSFTPEKESEIDEMLRVLGTDHADVVLTELHAPDARRIEAIRKQQDALRRKGKIRHAGFVCHGDMNEVLELVLDKHATYFDVALVAMKLVPNMADPAKAAGDEAGKRFLRNIQGLRKAGIGVLAMKTGGRKAVTQGVKVFQPLIKAYLQAGADSMLTSMDTLDQVDMVTRLELKSRRLDAGERRAAAAFHEAEAGTCRMCAECAKACPQGLPVNDLMRYRMYHEEYGWAEHARAEYAAGGVDFRAAAGRCGDCEACTSACPVGLASPQMVRRVSDLLA